MMTALNIRGLSEEVARDFRVQAAQMGMTHPEYLEWLLEQQKRKK